MLSVHEKTKGGPLGLPKELWTAESEYPHNTIDEKGAAYSSMKRLLDPDGGNGDNQRVEGHDYDLREVHPNLEQLVHPPPDGGYGLEYGPDLTPPRKGVLYVKKITLQNKHFIEYTVITPCGKRVKAKICQDELKDILDLAAFDESAPHFKDDFMGALIELKEKPKRLWDKLMHPFSPPEFTTAFAEILKITAAKKYTQPTAYVNPIAVDYSKEKDFNPKKPTLRDEVYYVAWGNYESQSAGGPLGSGFAYTKITTSHANNVMADTEIYQEIQYTNFIANGSGLILGGIVFYFLRSKFKKIKSNNPLYRVYDSFASFGAAVGDSLSFFPLPFVPHGAQSLISLFLGGILSFTFGLFTFPYWLYKRKHKVPLSEDNYRTHVQGWAYYTKTGQVMCSNLGAICGAAIKHTPVATYKGAALAGAGGFMISLIGVPIVNALTARKLSDQCAVAIISFEKYLKEREKFKRNSYLLIYRGVWELIYVDREQNHKKMPLTKVKGLADALRNYQGEVEQVENGHDEGAPFDDELSQEDIDTIYDTQSMEEANFSVEQELTEEVAAAQYQAEQSRKKHQLLKNQADKKNIEDLLIRHHYNIAMDTFRHNYIRTGIIVGVYLGNIIGYVASLFVPGANIVTMSINMLACGAGFGIAGGIYYGYRGGRISEQEHKGEYTDNSWDYVNRETAEIGGYIGGLIGLFVGGPIGPFIGVAIGSAVGWYLGYFVTPAARALEPNEEPTKTLCSWTIRVPVEAKKGGVIGALVGLTIGLAGGPLGVLAGLTLGFYIGSIAGWLYGAVAEEKSRTVLIKACQKVGSVIDDGYQRAKDYFLRPQAAAALAPLDLPHTPVSIVVPPSKTESPSASNVNPSLSAEDDVVSETPSPPSSSSPSPSRPEEGPQEEENVPVALPSKSPYATGGPALFCGSSIYVDEDYFSPTRSPRL